METYLTLPSVAAMTAAAIAFADHSKAHRVPQHRTED